MIRESLFVDTEAPLHPAFVVIAGIVVAVIIASTRKKDENVNKDITVNAEEITGA